MSVIDNAMVESAIHGILKNGYDGVPCREKRPMFRCWQEVPSTHAWSFNLGRDVVPT